VRFPIAKVAMTITPSAFPHRTAIVLLQEDTQFLTMVIPESFASNNVACKTVALASQSRESKSKE
jgi:hypothetical protein